MGFLEDAKRDARTPNVWGFGVRLVRALLSVVHRRPLEVRQDRSKDRRPNRAQRDRIRFEILRAAYRYRSGSSGDR